MRKLLVILMVATVFLLGACEYATDGERSGYSEEQIRNIIDDHLSNRDGESILYITEEQLASLIMDLMPTTLSPQEIADIVSLYVPTDLTQADILDLIFDLMPEDRYTSSYDLISFQAHLTQMLASRSLSVVGVQTFTETSGGTGSGVIYKRHGDTYYLVTNHHVIEDFIELEVIYERNGMLRTITNDKITFHGSDATTDLAVLSFTSDVEFPTVDFADSYDLTVGQIVVAVGNPLGFQYYGTATMGILSGTTRFLESGSFNATVIQHDAALSPGNSGGALFDINGNLIGINHMKIHDSRATNIGFAIPSNTVARIINDLEEYGFVVRPFLGITAAVYVNECGYDFGVCLSGVFEGGAAEAAGLLVDDVLIGYKHQDDVEFMQINNFNDLREAILNSRVGDTVIIQYIRNGETFESEPTQLNAHPDDVS